MSNDISKSKSQGKKRLRAKFTEVSATPTPIKLWGSFAAILWALLIYLVPQVVGGLLISIYPAMKHWDPIRTNDWLTNAVSAQFVYTLFAEVVSVGMVWLLIRHYKAAWWAIGLVLPKVKDLVYALSGFGVYFVVYLTLVIIVSQLVPAFNVSQQQNVGFDHTTGFVALSMAFVSLVILPPIAEEIIFRGFLYKGLRRKWSVRTATIVTSTLFAVPHLMEGVGGVLWVGGVDTFVLSLVLCYLREKTGRLTAGMGIHALKNGVAFAALFIFHVH